jgi:hypothetical protein
VRKLVRARPRSFLEEGSEERTDFGFGEHFVADLLEVVDRLGRVENTRTRESREQGAVDVGHDLTPSWSVRRGSTFLSDGKRLNMDRDAPRR